MLIHDLSTGHIIRQFRETDYSGNFIKAERSKNQGNGSQLMTSAFEDGKPYELTALGVQFVHYAMTEITVKIQYRSGMDEASTCQANEPENADV